jgi:uncharacterized protein (TIGR03663 family)
MSRMLMVGLLLAVIAAAALRLPHLDARPMHNDEGVNAIKLRDLWEHGAYKYDPAEYHGPTLYYITWAWMKLVVPKKFADWNESQLRMVTVLFGIGLILLLPLIADGLGRRATFCAAIFTALSPAMAFYSRYFIHEMPLVFFTFLALAAGWRYTRSGKLAWALLAGAAVGLMQATKETFVLAIAAMAVALMVNRMWRPGIEQKSTEKTEESRKPKSNSLLPTTVLYGLGVWLVVALVLFTSFFTNASGPVDAVRTYLPWLHRAGGASPHIHPWNFYLERLAWFQQEKGPVWSEGLILVLALIGFVAAFTRNGLPEGDARFVRFVAVYTILLTAIYSAIGYKTPWCLLSFWHGMILLAGVGTVALLHRLRKLRLRIAVGILLLALAGQLASQAWRADVVYAANPRNPYVYAQTVPDVENLIGKIEALAQAAPQKEKFLIKVMAPENDYGPLPWYLRRYRQQTGYWGELTADPYAPVMIVSTKFNAKLDENKTHQMAGLFQLRPQNWFELYVETNLWHAYVQSNKPAKE